MTNEPTQADDNDPTNTGSSSTAPLDKKPERDDGTKDPKKMDLTPQGLSDEPAKQEDPDSLAKPDNS
ncbi:hypothetical protein V1639_04060 [Pseudarthrobacter sp. J75]|uniref:hypothetical protein n=1 Tax=unclassified Pseudarthrobacter TaxID=2647000 RepID=UPI002E8111BE|nr:MULTISPECIES: hypothetical protein [unclassified Pseudarthrobacter]MEE2522148.1 hypothetical protein [Pseudarthrobacter sp. J47]MEE2528206.1 hypothetical protein [Pseudarthrobacter sp. J75]